MSRKLTDDMLKELNRICDRYCRHGVRMSNLIEIAEDAPESISDKAVIIGIRLALSHEYHEHEYFSIDDIVETTGDTREAVEKKLKELGIEASIVSSMIPGLFNDK